METQHMPLKRTGTPGLDVFKIAGRSISGFVHSFKTGDPRRVRQPFTSRLEEQLCLFLEYHPHVRYYQRGDASPACATTYSLVTDLGTPYRINYVFEGNPHEYLPDYVGTLCDGGLLIAEAGRESEKSKGKALVKAEAARRLAQIKGGEYWIGTDMNLSERRHQNWLYLHARRQPFTTFAEIADALLGVTIFFRENHSLRPLKSRSLSASCRLKRKRGVLKASLGPVLSSIGMSRTASEGVSSLSV